MQVRHLGHASIMVETDRARVLVDPGSLSQGWHDLTDLDVIAITHQHADHVDLDHLPALVAANPGARLLAEGETADMLGDHDITATAMHAGDSLRFGDLVLVGVGDTHAVIHPEIPTIGNVGLVVEQDDGARILHPGDALQATPTVDVLACPLAAPWASAAMVVDYAIAVGAPHVIPIHDAVLSEAGRGIHVGLLQRLTGDIALADLADGSRLTL